MLIRNFQKLPKENRWMSQYTAKQLLANSYSLLSYKYHSPTILEVLDGNFFLNMCDMKFHLVVELIYWKTIMIQNLIIF